MSSSMTSALATLDTFFTMAFSKLAHGTLSMPIPISTHRADTASSVICDAPSSELLPKARMVNVSIATSITIGMSDIMAEGRFLRCCSCFGFFSIYCVYYNLYCINMQWFVIGVQRYCLFA